MIIATWNVERLKHANRLDAIINLCENVRADILVLTEADERIHLPYKNRITTAPLPELQYAKTERRIVLYTNHEIINQHPTYNGQTSVCVELKTPSPLLVYGTIIGIYGNRHSSYKEELQAQVKDFASLSELGKDICICGDFNCSFSDNYYYTNAGREIIRQSLINNTLTLLTEAQSECIDHVAVSSRLVHNAMVSIMEWNIDKKLSDHKGIAVQIT